MHPAYKARARAAIAAAARVMDAEGSPEEALRAIRRNAGAGRLLPDRFTPRELALRASGFAPQGNPYRAATGGPASTSSVMVQEYLHRPTGMTVRCHA